MNSTAHIMIEQAGLLSIIEDFGRHGHQAFGVPVSGPMDRFSAMSANWLVGNPLDSPVIECTLLGPVIVFDGDVQVAITGADMSPVIDGRPVPRNETLKIRAGSKLRFSRAVSGTRCYLGIHGTWTEPHHGRTIANELSEDLVNTPRYILKKGSEFIVTYQNAIHDRQLPLDHRNQTWDLPEIRILEGPDSDWLRSGALDFMVSHEWMITNQANRMGYRLEGASDQANGIPEMISSGVIPGTIQLSKDGTPIILMCDAQTIGGYPRIANVITADLDKVGQLKPKHSLRFKHVKRETALAELAKRQRLIEYLFKDQ